MTLNEIHKAIEKIGSLTLTTLDSDTMHSRIISICGGDDEGIYFLTMDVKPFYRQLKNNPQVALCGIYPSSRKTGKNTVGQPTFAPGFTLRITGEAREIPEDEVKEKAATSRLSFFLFYGFYFYRFCALRPETFTLYLLLHRPSCCQSIVTGENEMIFYVCKTCELEILQNLVFRNPLRNRRSDSQILFRIPVDDEHRSTRLEDSVDLFEEVKTAFHFMIDVSDIGKIDGGVL